VFSTTSVILLAALVAGSSIRWALKVGIAYWFGRWVEPCRQNTHLPFSTSPRCEQRMAGVVTLLIAVLLGYWILNCSCFIYRQIGWNNVLSFLCSYSPIGWQSLREHALGNLYAFIAPPLSLWETYWKTRWTRLRWVISSAVIHKFKARNCRGRKPALSPVLENGSDCDFRAASFFGS